MARTAGYSQHTSMFWAAGGMATTVSEPEPNTW